MGVVRLTKKVITFEDDRQKGHHFGGKKRVTPSVTAPGDTK